MPVWITDEVRRKLTNEYVIGSPEEFLRAKKAHFHKDNILKKSFPHNWRSLKIDFYDGTKDSEYHVNLYLNILSRKPPIMAYCVGHSQARSRVTLIDGSSTY